MLTVEDNAASLKEKIKFQIPNVASEQLSY